MEHPLLFLLLDGGRVRRALSVVQFVVSDASLKNAKK